MERYTAGTVFLGDRERAGVRADEDILRDVLSALDGEGALLPFRRHVAAAVHDGIVRLSGHVPNPWLRNTAANLVWSVAGVEGVQNDLVDDRRLRTEVAQALGRDPHLHDLRLRVESALGDVTISGRIAVPTIRPQVADAARRVRGVVSVDVHGLVTGLREASAAA